MWPVNFEPVGWAFCSGQLMDISENDTLYQLLGTTYGGDGKNTFALPDLQGRIPIHQGTSLLGENGGSESVTLTVQQLPTHTHPLLASTTVASDTLVDNNLLAQASTFDPYNGRFRLVLQWRLRQSV
jgi:microcystin-dependent protein